MNNYNYRFADFVIHSEIPLPDLWPATCVDNHADSVMVRRGKVIEPADNASTRPGVCYQCAGYEFVLRTPVAAFLIRQGREVIVEPEPGKPEQDMRPFLSGPVMAILCYQRGIFVMHGCALQYQGKTIVLCGQSGCGKSTLSYGLVEKGWQLIADEIAPLRKAGEHLLPLLGKRNIYLWENAAEYFQLPLNDLSTVRSELRKYVVNTNVPEPPQSGAAVAAVVVLRRATTTAEVILEPATTTEAFNLLLDNGTYRSEWIQAMRLDVTRFEHYTRAVRSCDIYSLHSFPKIKALPTAINQLESLFFVGTSSGDTGVPAAD